LPGLLKQVSDTLFTFSEIFIQQLRTLYVNEAGFAGIGNGLGHHSLTTARRAIEQNPSSFLQPELLTKLWVSQWIEDQIFELLFDLMKSTNVIEGDQWNVTKSLPFDDWVGHK
jgi:hypothetical protein